MTCKLSKVILNVFGYEICFMLLIIHTAYGYPLNQTYEHFSIHYCQRHMHEKSQYKNYIIYTTGIDGG